MVKRDLLGFIGVLTGAGAFVFESFINPSAISSHLLKDLEIGTEPLIGRRTVLEAFEIGLELYGGLCRKAVNHPGSVSGAFDHALPPKVGEMLRNLGLCDAENFLEMADAKRTTCKQMDDPQSRGVAETLVNLNQFHGRNMAWPIYSSTLILSIMNVVIHESPARRGPLFGSGLNDSGLKKEES